MTKLVIDYDPYLFAAACVGEKRSIKVIHQTSGDEYEFDTRTQFFGHHKAKAGGWLAEYNKGRDSPRLPDEFDIIDIQTPEALSHSVAILDSMLKGTFERLGCNNYYGYTGSGEVFRHDLATILPYKGNRIGLLRPTHLTALKEYVVKKHNCTVVQGIECDDAVSIDSYAAYQKWKETKSDKDKLVTVIGEKDFLQCASHLYNMRSDGSDVCSYGGFGWLELNAKKEVKGRGRLFHYHQVLSSDKSDNYAANSACDMRWGDMNSYNLLSKCKNDKEAFEAMIRGYKTLYPSPKIITGHRGNEIEIDFMYVMQENFNLAKLLRTRDEKPTVLKDVLTKLGINYEQL